MMGVLGLGALSSGLLMGGLTAASGVAGGLASSARERQQGQNIEMQAQQLRNQAEIQKAGGIQKQRAIDRQKNEISRRHRALQAQNNVSLALGNVDASSGSGMQVAEGNAALFADDIGENAYNRALSGWETSEQVKQTLYQADVYDAQSSMLKKTAGNVGGTLLSAGLSGLASGLGTYLAMGGTLFPESADVLVNAVPENAWGIDGFVPESLLKAEDAAGLKNGGFWDAALGQWVKNPVRH